MIQKVLMSGYDDRSEFPSSVLLPTFSKGFDPVVLRKQASIFEKNTTHSNGNRGIATSI